MLRRNTYVSFASNVSSPLFLHSFYGIYYPSNHIVFFTVFILVCKLFNCILLCRNLYPSICILQLFFNLLSFIFILYILAQIDHSTCSELPSRYIIPIYPETCFFFLSGIYKVIT